MTTERKEALASLKKHLRRGDTVFTVLRRVSSTGMMRWLDLYVMRKNQPVRLTWSAANALGWTYDREREALKVGGCGMDMGFHVVNSLSYALHGHGKKDSGYTLTQRWL